jgi:nitrogen regulatory protein P-II 1
MKIEAVIGPSRLDEVRKALASLWVHGLTVTEVKGNAGQAVERYRGAARQAGFAPLLRIEVVVPSPLVPRIVHDLARALRDGRGDDELLVVEPVVEAYRVRTGERGEGAL